MTTPLVGIIMGSDSDLPTMQAAIAICEDFEVAHEVAIVSAHRTPDRMVTYAKTAHSRGLQVIIAGAGGGRASARHGSGPHPAARHRGAGHQSRPQRR